MKQDFPALWAESPASQRREPTNSEMAGGFPCGDLDLQLFNELFYRVAQGYRELSYVITASGQAPNQNDTTQVWKAILAAVASGAAPVYYGLASGTPTALAVTTTTPALKTPIARGSIALVEMPSTLSMGAGASIAFGLNAATPLLRGNGTPVQDRDGPPGSFLLLGYNGTRWRLLTPGQAEVPRLLSGKTLYVATDGDDAADGFSESAPLRTIDTALRRSTLLYQFGRALTIQLTKTGTYPLPTSYPDIAGSIILRGDPNAQSGYVLSGYVNADAYSLSVIGATVRNPNSTAFTASVSAGGRLYLERTTLTSVNPLTTFHIYNSASFLTISNGCIWDKSSSGMIGQRSGSSEILTGSQLTVTGNPTWSDAAFSGTDGGNLVARGSVAISGAASGSRYRVDANFTARTFGLGENLFPGDQAGTKTNGAYYFP